MSDDEALAIVKRIALPDGWTSTTGSLGGHPTVTICAPTGWGMAFTDGDAIRSTIAGVTATAPGTTTYVAPDIAPPDGTDLHTPDATSMVSGVAWDTR